MWKWLFLAIISICSAYNGCLHQRSICLRNSECRTYFDNFENICGFSLSSCAVQSPSDCVHTLWRIREFFPYDACVCYEAIGFSEQCNQFRELIWNHPCERKMSDAGEERRTIEWPSRHHDNTLTHRRTTRTPLSDQIQQLKTQLSGDLGSSTREVLSSTTCDSALNDICLRHVSCRQLWRLFRTSCGVDQDNRCTMADRDACWQSFEGLSWTGLGNCRCDSSNSDCHWIRLHTNYNKCIHEIFKTDGPTSLRGTNDTGRSSSDRAHPQRGTFLQPTNNWEVAVTAAALPSHPTTTRPTVPTTTTTTVITTNTKATASITTTAATTTRRPPRTDSRKIKVLTTYQPRVAIWTTMVPSWNRGRAENRPQVRTSVQASQLLSAQSLPVHHHSNYQRHVAKQAHADLHYRPLFEAHVKTTPSYYYYYTTAVPRWDSYATTPAERRQDDTAQAVGQQRSMVDQKYSSWNPRKPTQLTNQPQPTRASSTSFKQLEYSIRSSCQDAMTRCEAADECRWHLGELRVRCAPSSCRRTDCAAALQRFARFVPFTLVESMMFCHCSTGDSLCAEQQEIIYPKCLYSTSSTALTCTEAVRKCDEEHRCRHLRHSLATNCPVAHDACARTSLDECRRTILNARASILEQPCYCPLSDVECMAYQRMMIPNNPCIEKAMLDYSRLMGYNTITAEKTVSIETNRVLESTEQPEVKGRYRPEKTKTMSDNRDVVNSGSDGYSGGSRREHGREEQVRNLTNPDWPRQRIVVDKWKVSSMPKEAWAPEPRNSDLVKATLATSTWTTTYKRNQNITSEGRRKEKPRTTLSPITTEPPPPWVTTTEETSTTTVTFVTHPPPPKEGCTAKDASGREIFVHTGSVMRRYVDWSARCSSWCECVAEDELVCERLPCLEDGRCEAPLTTIDFGERLFLRDRGACFCESGAFICDLPEEMPEVYPGLYLSAGYSTTDVEMLRSEVPHDVLERAGFVSSNAATDIAGQLQIVFERLLPKGLQCRIVLMPEISDPGSAFMRIEWFGMNTVLNHTKTQWHTGGAEKVCSPYANKLSDYFSLSESPRFQLILSTVKQLKVLDHLDGLPSSISDVKYFLVVIVSLYKMIV